MNKFLHSALLILILFIVSCTNKSDTYEQVRSFGNISQQLATNVSSSVVEYHIDDYWQPGDYIVGYKGIMSTPGDPNDINGNKDVDWSITLNRLISNIRDTHTNNALPTPPIRILFDKRNTYHFYNTIKLNFPIILEGIGNPYRSGSTRLLFHGVTGIHVGDLLGGPIPYYGGAIIKGLDIAYVGSNKETIENDGILINRTSRVQDVIVRNFPGHGIHLQGTVQLGSNVSLSSISDSTVLYNGLSGVWIEGKDAQVIKVTAVNSMYNGVRRVDGDGFGFSSRSMLGVTFEVCHTRNNYIAGYFAGRYQNVAPNRDTFINCYSEKGAAPNPELLLEGPPILEENALVITSNGDGNLTDAVGGASIMSTTVGKIEFRNVMSVRGKNGILNIWGDKTEAIPNDGNVRITNLFSSYAYGMSDTDTDKYYFVHNPKQGVRSWGYARNPLATLTFGFTDKNHLRPALPVAPNGILIGNYSNKTIAENGIADGPRRIGYWDPRNENLLNGSFPNPLVGDVVLNSIPSKTLYNFVGWVYSFDSSIGGTKHWYRYGENLIGTQVP